MEKLNLGTRTVTDIHDGLVSSPPVPLKANLCCRGIGAVSDSLGLFASKAGTYGAVNAETNAGTHHMARAVMEGADLNQFFGCDGPQCPRCGRWWEALSDEASHWDLEYCFELLPSARNAAATLMRLTKVGDAPCNSSSWVVT